LRIVDEPTGFIKPVGLAPGLLDWSQGDGPVGLGKAGHVAGDSLVDAFDESAIDGTEFLAGEAQPETHQVELPEYGLERSWVILPEIRECAVVGAQVASQPDGLQVFGANVLKTAAGTGTLEVSPKIEF
jgi:hypothetical protein